MRNPRDSLLYASIACAVIGVHDVARAQTTFPDGYLSLAVAIANTALPEFQTTLVADPRYAGSNCDMNVKTLASSKAKRFLPRPYKAGQTRASIARDYSVIVVVCATSVTDGIFTLLGEKSLQFTKTHPSTPVQITAMVASSLAGPSGCFPRNCNGSLRKSLSPCGPLC
jgi:hypothetical protein